MAIQISPDFIEYRRNEMRSDRIRVIDGEPAITVTIRPDNVIGPREAPWLIVDAKYKDPMRWREGKQYFHNEDLYQAFTYAAALDAPAVLVYPRVDRDVDVEIGAGGHGVRIMSLSLMCRAFKEGATACLSSLIPVQLSHVEKES